MLQKLFPGASGPYLRAIHGNQMPLLIVLYSAGYAGIYGLLAAMTWRAWTRRAALALDSCELAHTK